MNSVLVGQTKPVRLAVVALLAGGHVILEDVPGVGKTLLAKSLAMSIKSGFKRVQCTPDLLPSDVSGVSIFEQREGVFKFIPGPIFTNILLCDENQPRYAKNSIESARSNGRTASHNRWCNQKIA